MKFFIPIVPGTLFLIESVVEIVTVPSEIW